MRKAWPPVTRKFKAEARSKTETDQPQDEVPEWYDPARREVNCGRYECERLGHPPDILVESNSVKLQGGIK